MGMRWMGVAGKRRATWACAHLRHAPRHVVHGQEHGRETGAYAAWAGARTLACGPWGHACASACGRMGMWPVAHWAMPQCGHHVGKRAHVDMCGHVVHGHGVDGRATWPMGVRRGRWACGVHSGTASPCGCMLSICCQWSSAERLMQVVVQPNLAVEAVCSGVWHNSQHDFTESHVRHLSHLCCVWQSAAMSTGYQEARKQEWAKRNRLRLRVAHLLNARTAATDTYCAVRATTADRVHPCLRAFMPIPVRTQTLCPCPGSR